MTGSGQWTYSGEIARVGAEGAVTLVDEQSFCLASANGDILRASSHGLFVFDNRFLSELRLTRKDVYCRYQPRSPHGSLIMEPLPRPEPHSFAIPDG